MVAPNPAGRYFERQLPVEKYVPWSRLRLRSVANSGEAGKRRLPAVSWAEIGDRICARSGQRRTNRVGGACRKRRRERRGAMGNGERRKKRLCRYVRRRAPGRRGLRS